MHDNQARSRCPGPWRSSTMSFRPSTTAWSMASIADVETTRFVRANAAICQMLGYTEAELLARLVSDIHPAQNLPAKLGDVSVQVEGRIRVNDNAPPVQGPQLFYADITGQTITYKGRPCLIKFFRDITERKNVQQKLEQEQKALKLLLEASDDERQLNGYEIHDGLAQQLAGAMMQFEVFNISKDKILRTSRKSLRPRPTTDPVKPMPKRGG